MKYKNGLKVFAMAALTASLCMPIHATDKEAEFDLYASVYDYGARVNKVVCELPEEVLMDSIQKDTFRVVSDNKSTINLEVDNGERTIEDIYVSDSKDGERQNSGNYIIIELETNLNTQYSDVLQWDDPSFSNAPLQVEYKVEQVKPMRTTEEKETLYTWKQDEFKQELVDDFTEGESHGIHYRDYKPEEDGNKHPLIIWLHGAGEGGLNNVTHINGNKGAVAFVSEEAKEVFDDPYVLAPQSSDYWMPELELGDLVLKGTDVTKDLVACIRDYMDQNQGIDPTRVYIGGCSMGGYQTWEALFEAPDLFAAAFPICAAYEVPADKMEALKDIPLWIIHSENDSTIPVQYSRDAYENFKKAGGQATYIEYPNVQVEGQDYESHAVWVYPLNNETKDEEGTTFFQWLASQKKEEQTTNWMPLIVVTLVVAGAIFFMKRKK